MSISPAQAAEAYLRAAQSQGGGAAGGEEGGVSFGEMLGDVIRTNIETARAGETGITAAAAGQANLVDVVTAVSAAELALETVVSVRDRVIAAYQDVMRMPI